MDSRIEERILDMLLRDGRVSADDLERAASEAPVPHETGQGAGWGARLQSLIRRGVIGEDEIAPLLDVLRSEGFPTDDFSPPSVPPNETARALTPEDFPIKGWERYHVISVLGAGGMGVVYKARDPRLERPVALKIARGGEPRHKARFLREARAQARLSHENICRIYEVGEEQGIPYIAMQCIEGKTLHEARGEMALEEKAVVIRKAAEAVHEAHRLGIIHRDIKPGNIMVERGPGGEWTPIVLDFGLARDFDGPETMATGSIVGTPSFLSPEQANGKQVDRRSDVYSLGATLYYLLAGSPPFDGTPLETLGRLAFNDPAPLRSKAPSVPKELEAVVMKCLEREPSRRYDSAKALADDLGRFLDGEPVRAKRHGPIARIARKARKHPLLSSLFALAALAIVASAAAAARSAIRAREQIAVASRFEQEVLYCEKRLEYAYTAPNGNPRAERERIAADLARINNEITALGKVALGPGHYALGRVYLALHRDEESQAELELAWDRYGYRSPQVAYALGLALASRYRGELGRAALIPAGAQREARLIALNKQFGEPAAAFFKLCEGHWADSRDYGEALVAFLDKRYAGAARMAASSLEAYPWLYDAAILEGDAYAAIGTMDREKGDNAGALHNYGLAEKAYDAALNRAPNDAPGYDKLGLLETAVMALKTYQTGASPREGYEKALAACDNALKADPSSAGAFATRAYACWRWGEYQLYRGEDPSQALKEAAQAGERAVALAPSDPFALNELGTAFYIKGEWELGKGQDPRPSFSSAESAYDKAISLDPSDSVALSNLGGLNGMTGQYLLQSGADPRQSLDKAIAAYHRLLAQNPKDARALSNMGNVFGIQGEYEMKRGLDPSGAMARAIACFKDAAAINPNHANAWVNLGVANLALAKYENQRGKNTAASLQEALGDFDKALAIRPDFAAAISGKAEAQALAKSALRN